MIAAATGSFGVAVKITVVYYARADHAGGGMRVLFWRDSTGGECGVRGR